MSDDRLSSQALRPENMRVRPKEGMDATALSWVVISVLGCLPFMITGEIPSFADAFFETVSGFMTTGASIMTTLDGMSCGSLFWRSFTHWVGGMGVLVFILAVLPNTSSTFMNLMVAESPGPSVSKLVPTLRQTAKYLYGIYFGLTLIQIVLLLLAGMPLFDSITLTMGTAGTGGFSVRSNGFADYTILQQAIIGVFMMLFGINFSFYFLIVRRKYWEAFHMEEVITYISIIAIVTLLIVCSVYTLFPSVFEAIHHVFFTVSSIITTTGYATVDFNKWTPFARTLVVLIMFIGACAGSTGGGIKVSRLNVLAKGIKKEVQTFLHPNLVRKVCMDGKLVPHETVRSINVFLSIYLITFVICLVLVTLDGKDLVTSFTSVAATLNNIGPGLGEVGPMGNYAGFSDFSKYVLSIAMLAGRLELLPILLLLVPSMWKGTIRLTSRLSAGARNTFGRMPLFRSGKERSAVMKKSEAEAAGPAG
ncbi:TrkH family potassium uptake protein [Allobaculum mucilyticum]|uniref:TrkH family potassium uptake protein n=2 Tax=Allobaculum mucilyticum TaxID=2834459 RepID=UPI001E63F09C